MDQPYFIIYASTAERAFTQHELFVLLEVCREKNQRNEVTGLLLYSAGKGEEKGTFVQILEGPKARVDATYRKILTDEKHSDCTILDQGTVFQRRFGEWTMGFRDLREVKPEEIKGFNALFLNDWTVAKVLAEKDPVLQLLYSFAAT